MIEKQNESQNQINRKINLFILLNKPLRDFFHVAKSTKKCILLQFILLHGFE